MKKMLSLLCVLLMLLPAAAATEEEILFRGLPWDLDAVSFWEQVQEQLGTPLDTDTFAGSYLSSQAVVEQAWLTYFDEAAPAFSAMGGPDNAMSYRVYISAKDTALVAGLPISLVTAYALPTVYNGVVSSGASESRVVNSAYSLDLDRIPDPDSAFESLADKLESLYGAADLHYAESSYEATVWLGAGDTYVMLTRMLNNDQSTFSIRIEYGLTNVPELIDVINHPESTIDRDSLDGL